jgi:sugar-specific transcriptional regulator TrmB
MSDVSEKVKKDLENLGLTGYEIKAYLCLIEHGPMVASEISKESGIPYSKIYEVLKGLEDKGWIEIEETRPTRYYARSPDVAIEVMREKIVNERREREKEVLAELLPIYEKRGAKEKPEIWIVRGEGSIIEKVNELLKACEKELMVAVPSSFTNSIMMFAPILQELRDKGVKIMMMVGKDISKDLLISLARFGEVRLRNQMFGGGLIADAKHVVLLLSGDQGSYLAIWAEHVGLAKFARDYFEYLWNDSKKIKLWEIKD